jgi:heme oxygenase (biliverdin-producing, ferredoxin)
MREPIREARRQPLWLATGASVSVDLLTALRQASHALHHEVERTDVMQRLIAGRLPAGVFHALQRNLHALYAALEAALQRHAGLISGCCPTWPPLDRLARSERLVADLEQLHGPDWATALPLLPATRAYVDRLSALDRSAPRELLAHAYVRYFGDLAGGQLLARRVQASYGLAGGAGTSFFAFGAPEDVAALVATLRSALQDCRLEPGGVDALAAEAQWSFAQHAQMFLELAAATTSSMRSQAVSGPVDGTPAPAARPT